MAELQYRLNCDPKDLEFLPDILFNRGFAQTLNQELCAAVLAQTGVTRHTLACFDAPQHPDSGPEAPVVLDTRTSLSLCILPLLSPPVSFLSHLRKVLVFFTPERKTGVCSSCPLVQFPVPWGQEERSKSWLWPESHCWTPSPFQVFLLY